MRGHNKAFASAPFAYVQKYAINHLAMKVYGEKDAYDFDDAVTYDELGRIKPGAYSAYNNGVNQAKKAVELQGEGFFDIEPVPFAGGTVMYLRFVVPGRFEPVVEYGGYAQGADPPLDAYWLGYEMPGLQGAGKGRIPFVDLPKTAPAHSLMLTGAMNGCSMVVTLKPGDPTRLRVYHDSVHNKDTFKNDVVICRIDYTDEGYASANKAAPLIGAVPAPTGRARSKSVGDAPVQALAAPMPCVRHSYGDIVQYRAAESGFGSPIAGTDVKVRTSFNFLYYDALRSKWVAVSQPLETQKSSPAPVKAWYEAVQESVHGSSASYALRVKKHKRRGQHVAMPPASPPWTSVIPH